MIFPISDHPNAKWEFDKEIEYYKSMTGADWLKLQKSKYSQFSGEAGRKPKDDFLKAIGYIVWCNSLYEVKIRRAKFWLECYIENRIINLPGQRNPHNQNIQELKKLLRNEKVVSLFEEATVIVFESSIEKTLNSTKLRHDIIHGHHQGGWGLENSIFRTPSKIFAKESSYFIQPSSRKINLHANKILKAAALFALIDHFFDGVYNNW